MTANDYILAGYEISKQVSEEIITRAENDVMNAYVIPILGAEATFEDNKCDVMGLAYCLMLRRNIVKTRFGAEIKNNQYGTVLQYENGILNQQIAGICQPIFRSLKTKSAAAETSESGFSIGNWLMGLMPARLSSSKRFSKVVDIIDGGFYRY